MVLCLGAQRFPNMIVMIQQCKGDSILVVKYTVLKIHFQVSIGLIIAEN